MQNRGGGTAAQREGRGIYLIFLLSALYASIPGEMACRILLWGHCLGRRLWTPRKQSASMNKVQRGDRILQMLADSKIIKDSSVSAIKQALDPMHDTQLSKLSGWPDANTAPSIVRCVKQTKVVSLPSGTGFTSWDLHIQNWQWVNSLPYCNKIMPRYNNIVNASTAGPLYTDWTTTGVSIGGVTASYTNNGANFDVLTTSNSLANLDLSSSFIEGASRVIGIGIEAVNVTPQLYIGGQVGVFRLAEPAHDTQMFNFSAAGPSSGFITRAPPRNFAEMMLIPGTRQWEAKDGFYLVVPMLEAENPARIPQYVLPLIPALGTIEDHVTNDSSGSLGWNTGTLGVPAWTTLNGQPGFTTNILAPPCIASIPFHQGGAIFSGLAPEAQIALTVVYYVEEFPGFAQKELLTLANPSASYDPVAMEILTHAFKTLPVGVPANMNGLGDWFALAVRAAGSVIAPLAMAMGQPAIAALAGGASMAANNYLTAPTPTLGKVKAREINNRLNNLNSGPPPPALPSRDAAYQQQANVIKQDRKRLKKARKKLIADSATVRR